MSNVNQITKPIIIECDRSKSRSVSTLGFDKSQNTRASWVNDVKPFNIPRGSKVNIEAVCVNTEGVGGDVIEVNDLNVDETHPYRSNYCMIEMAYYINHNGTNSVGLPYIAQNDSTSIGGNNTINQYGIFTDPANANYGAGNSANYKFCVGGATQATKSLIDNPSRMRCRNPDLEIKTEDKYTKISENYRGWWNKDTTTYPLLSALTGVIPIEFTTGELDPDTIGDTITIALHQTDGQDQANLDIPEASKVDRENAAQYELQPLPNFTGIAVKSIRANGQGYSDEEDSIYSALFVKDIFRWKLIDRWMRLECDPMNANIIGGNYTNTALYPILLARCVDSTGPTNISQLPYFDVDTATQAFDYNGSIFAYTDVLGVIHTFTMSNVDYTGGALPKIDGKQMDYCIRYITTHSVAGVPTTTNCWEIHNVYKIYFVHKSTHIDFDIYDGTSVGLGSCTYDVGTFSFVFDADASLVYLYNDPRPGNNWLVSPGVYKRFVAPATGARLAQGCLWDVYTEATATSAVGAIDINYHYFVNFTAKTAPVGIPAADQPTTSDTAAIWTAGNNAYLGAYINTTVSKTITLVPNTATGTPPGNLVLTQRPPPGANPTILGMMTQTWVRQAPGSEPTPIPAGSDLDNDFLDIPEYFFIPTNIQLRYKNYVLLENQFRDNERYAGTDDTMTYEEMQDDNNNYYIDVDVGRTHDDPSHAEGDINTKILPPMNPYPAQAITEYISKYAPKGSGAYTIGGVDGINSLRIKSRYLSDWENLFTTAGRIGTSNPISLRPDIYTIPGEKIVKNGSDPEGVSYETTWEAMKANKIGMYPYQYTKSNGDVVILLGFLAYADAMTGNGKDNVGVMGDNKTNRRSCWSYYDANFIGFSPSFNDNYAVLPITTDGVANNNNLNQYSNWIGDYTNYMWIGAGGGGGMSCSYDSNQARFTFGGFYTPRIYNQTDTGGITGVVGVGDEVVAFHDTNIQFERRTQPKTNSTGAMNSGFNDSLSGCWFWGLFWANEGTSPQSTTDTGIVRSSPTMWFGSIFQRMGFTYYDIFPRFGLQNQRFDNYYYNRIESGNRYRCVKPLTLNSRLDTSVAQTLNVYGNNQIVANVGKPKYELGYSSFLPVFMQQINTTLPATNLATKLDYPYYQIYSNIAGNNVYLNGDGQELQCLGYALKNYKSNNFWFSYAMSFDTFYTNVRNISSIRTELRNPDGRVVNAGTLGDRCVVFYKVVIPQNLPLMDQPNPEEEQLKELKDIKEELEEENDRDETSDNLTHELLRNIESGRVDNTVRSSIDKLFEKTSAEYKFGSGEVVSANELHSRIVQELYRQYIEAIGRTYPLSTVRGQLSMNVKNFIPYLSRALIEGSAKTNELIENFSNELRRAKTGKQKTRLLDDMVRRLERPRITATGKYLERGSGEQQTTQPYTIEFTPEFSRLIYDELNVRDPNVSKSNLMRRLIDLIKQGLSQDEITVSTGSGDNKQSLNQAITRSIRGTGTARGKAKFVQLRPRTTPLQRKEMDIPSEAIRGRLTQAQRELFRQTDIHDLRRMKERLERQARQTTDPSQIRDIDQRLQDVERVMNAKQRGALLKPTRAEREARGEQVERRRKRIVGRQRERELMERRRREAEGERT